MAQVTRKKVEPGIWKRVKADGSDTFEVTWRDAYGRQRRQTVEGGITAARRFRNEKLAQRDRGEAVPRNPRLKFEDAAEAWLAAPHSWAPNTEAAYRNAVTQHLLPRYAHRRLDSITPGNVAALVQELRAEGLGDWTIVKALNVLGSVYKHAKRHQGWAGENPVEALDKDERPAQESERKVIFAPDQMVQLIAACQGREPWATLLTLLALTGARISEALGLTWGDVEIDDPERAMLHFRQQVDRNGKPRPLKTRQSDRYLMIPPGLARVLLTYRGHEYDPDAYVFATRTGRPLSQRNVSRALRAAQKRATVPDSDVTYCETCRRAHAEPTFPALHNGRVARGELPSLHSFRHTYATLRFDEGLSTDEVASLLGDKVATVERVYVHEIADGQRARALRERVNSISLGSILAAQEAESPLPKALIEAA